MQLLDIATEMLEATKKKEDFERYVMMHGELMKSADHYHDVATAS